MYLKNFKANKFSKTTNAVHSNHLQVCQSVSLFVFAVLFKSSIHVLSGYIFCVTQFGGSTPQYPLFEFW